jgi:hypothetical protein
VKVSMARRVCRGAKDAGSGEQDVREMHLEGVVGYDVAKECRVALAQAVRSAFWEDRVRVFRVSNSCTVATSP